MIDTKYIDQYIQALSEHELFEKKHIYVGRPIAMYYAEYGRKYARIVRDQGQRMVHAFVDLTNGDVLKSGGWSSPQREKNGMAVRYNLVDDYSRETCFSRIDTYGRYLYKN
jgi:hypothetical protein